MDSRQAKKLAALIGKLTPSSDIAKFRNEWRDEVDGVSDEERPALVDARSLVERWAAQVDGSEEALREWSDFYLRTRSVLPRAIRIACLGKLPVSAQGVAAWRDFLVNCTEVDIVRTALRNRHFARKDVRNWLTDSPNAFGSSALLDFAIESGLVKNWKDVWDICARLNARPSSLLQKSDLLVACYSHWSGKDADTALANFMEGAPETCAALLPLLIANSRVAIRIAQLFAGIAATSALDAKDLPCLSAFVTHCSQRVVAVNDANTSAIAALAFSTFRLRLVEATCEAKIELNPSIESLTSAAAVGLSRSILQSIEENASAPVSSVFLLLSGRELFKSAIEHVKSVSNAGSSQKALTGRDASYEQHLGKKSVLLDVISVIDRLSPDGRLRDELNAVLFNSGVRPVGTAGELIAFDPRLHSPLEPGILPGEQVQIAKAGRRLGEGQNSLVLTKARVRHPL